MTPEIFVQLLLNAIVAGAVYALVAASFSIIYSTNKFIHMAHGSVIALNVYILYFLFSVLGINFPISVMLTCVGSMFIGFGINKFYNQFREKKASLVILLLASIALMIFLDALILLLFGGNLKSIGLIKAAKGISFLGAVITPMQIVIIISSFIVLLAFSIFIKKSSLGVTMRAVADNKELAEILGVSANQSYAFSFVIGCLIAAVSGIFYGLEYHLTPTIGVKLIFTGFAAVVVGGIGSIKGAILGAFVIALVENFGIWFLPSGYKDAIGFMVLFVFLVFRPQGIFGFKNKISL